MPRDDCKHARGENPRYQDRCIKCDALLPPTHRDRNPPLERELVEYAARGACDPEALITHMQTRSAFSSTVRLGVDWIREGREELADFANYLVWWLETNPEHPDFERKLQAVRLVAQAYDLTAEDD